MGAQMMILKKLRGKLESSKISLGIIKAIMVMRVILVEMGGTF